MSHQSAGYSQHAKHPPELDSRLMTGATNMLYSQSSNCFCKAADSNFIRGLFGNSLYSQETYDGERAQKIELLRMGEACEACATGLPSILFDNNFIILHLFLY